MKVLVSGLLNIETTVAVRGFPIPYYPIDYPFFGVASRVSGVGYNIARALATLGDSVTPVSFVGKDAEGERVLRQLSADGLCTDRVFPALQSTPVSAVLYDPAGRRQIYCDLKDVQDRRLDPAALRGALGACDFAVLCNINFNRDLIKEARARGIPTATDVHVLGSVEDDYNRDFMENADVLFLSDEALPEAPEAFLRRLYDRYRSRVLVLGRGAKGALLLDGAAGALVSVPAWTDGPVVNTVGAGDALFSAFLHFYAKGEPAKDALQKAVVFAGVKIGYDGASAGFCTEADLLEKLRSSNKT